MRIHLLIFAAVFALGAKANCGELQRACVTSLTTEREGSSGVTISDQKRRQIILESPLSRLVEGRVLYSDAFYNALRGVALNGPHHNQFKAEFPAQIAALSSYNRQILAEDVYQSLESELAIYQAERKQNVILHHGALNPAALTNYSIYENVGPSLFKYSKEFVVRSMVENLIAVGAAGEFLDFNKEVQILSKFRNKVKNVAVAAVTTSMMALDLLLFHNGFSSTIGGFGGFGYLAYSIAETPGKQGTAGFNRSKQRVLLQINRNHEDYRRQIPEAPATPFENIKYVDDLKAQLENITPNYSPNSNEALVAIHQQLIVTFGHEYIC